MNSLNLKYIKNKLILFYEENGESKEINIPKVNKHLYMMTQGLSFYDGTRTGLAKRICDNKEFYFFVEETKISQKRAYVLVEMTEGQKLKINFYIELFEIICGTYCGFRDGNRITNQHPDYRDYIDSNNFNWMRFNDLVKSLKLDNRIGPIKNEQIIGWTDYYGFYRAGSQDI